MNDQLSSDLASLRIDRTAHARTTYGRGGRVLRWTLVAALLAGAGWAVHHFLPSVQAQVFKTEVAVTEIALVSPAQASIDLTSTGYVVPQVVADVASKIVGRVQKVTVREGDQVKAGQTLVELDAMDQHTQIASAQARVASARARAAASRAQVAEIQQQYEREKRLAASGAIAQSSADDLEARVKSLQEQVKASEADVVAAQAEVNSLNVNLANLTLKAPIDGRVLNQPMAMGEVATPGLTLFKIADFESILVETDVAEARLHLVKKGGPCEIILDAYPDKRWRGEVAWVSPMLNRAKATAMAKVRFLDRDDTVLPDMAARVSFLARQLDDAQMKEPPKIVMPGSAVTERLGAKVVFVVADDKVRIVPVTLGPAFGSGFELTQGPAPGTKIVNEPPPTLADGQSIKERSP
jgi:RND family efflux transporter MFP subunit